MAWESPAAIDHIAGGEPVNFTASAQVVAGDGWAVTVTV
jgi:hypothetical protein